MATKVTQKNRPLELITPLGADVLLASGFRGEEALSRPFRFLISLAAHLDNVSKITFEKLLGQKITLRLNSVGGKPRFFSGICQRFNQGSRDEDFAYYQMEIVPQFWLLTKRAQTRIFQQNTVPNILKKVLEGLDVVYQLQGVYEPRNYCVQYRETDFNFASRLMEEEGVYYFFTHSESGHKMVVADTPQSHPDLPLAARIKFERQIGSGQREEAVYFWEKSQELITGKHTLWDHSFELPGRNLEAQQKVADSVAVGTVTHPLKAGQADSREVYDFPGDYAVRFDGVNPSGGDQPGDIAKISTDNLRTVKIRNQQEAVTAISILGTSSARNFISGHKFELHNHPDANGQYVITHITHSTGQPTNFRSGEGDSIHYTNNFQAIPLGLPYRPQRLSPKPFVQGTQTATVVGPAGTEIFTDKYGRVKVQFHWDREGKKDARSSCWVRVAQIWAGKRWGASFWPRIGQEVVVAFIEGNPDWPILVGSVYNAEQMPPYLGEGLDPKHVHDNKVCGVKSNSTPGGEGFNEWRFDDTKGQEEIFIHAERNLDTRVKNDLMEFVLHDRHLIVGMEKDGKKLGEQRERVFLHKHQHVDGNQVEHIEGNQEIKVGIEGSGGDLDVIIKKDRKELIEGSQHKHVKQSRFQRIEKNDSKIVNGAQNEHIDGDTSLFIGGNHVQQVKATQALTTGGNQLESVAGTVHRKIGKDRNEKIGGNVSLDIGQNRDEKIGMVHALDAGQTIHLKAGMNVVIEAGMQLTLKGPGGFIDIGPAGVAISGTMVLINSGGAPGTGPGASPVEPESPATPKKPTEPTDPKEAKPLDPLVADDSKTGFKSAP